MSLSKKLVRTLALEQLQTVKSQKGKYLHIADPVKLEAGIIHPACGAGLNAHHEHKAYYEISKGEIDCPKCLKLRYKRRNGQTNEAYFIKKQQAEELRANIVPLYTSGFIYLIQSSNGLYKIGFTNNLKNRLSQLQSASPVVLTLRWSKHFSNAL